MIDRPQVKYGTCGGLFVFERGIIMPSERLSRLINMTPGETGAAAPSFASGASKEEVIEYDMERALRENQFKVYYQSKHKTSTGQLVGAEALVRWDHRELGLMGPNDFVPVFEKNGFIKKMDAYVRDVVFSDMERWRINNYRMVPISVNLSRRDFEDMDLVDSILYSTRKHNIDHSLLCFEITETASVDNQTAIIRAVNRLRDNGFTVALDDFGSGYSSLSLLNEMSLDSLKIDRDLLGYINDGKGQYLLDTCIKLGQNYNLSTEVEGVETKEQYEMLKAMDCDSVQGFYFARPLPADVFEMRLKEQ